MPCSPVLEFSIVEQLFHTKLLAKIQTFSEGSETDHIPGPPVWGMGKKVYF